MKTLASPSGHPVPAAPATPAITDKRDVFDPQEACHLVNQGWRLLELVTTTRWAQGYRSESTTYTLGLPAPVLGLAS